MPTHSRPVVILTPLPKGMSRFEVDVRDNAMAYNLGTRGISHIALCVFYSTTVYTSPDYDSLSSHWIMANRVLQRHG